LPYSRINIHEPSKGSIPDKTIESFEGIVNDLHYYKDVITDIIADRTKLTKEQVTAMITNRNQFFYAPEALDNGFATKIVHGL
jgi:ATP-dependent protease ClpP protease subunit